MKTFYWAMSILFLTMAGSVVVMMSIRVHTLDKAAGNLLFTGYIGGLVFGVCCATAGMFWSLSKKE